MQVREVRALVRELGRRHTILLSTHIMSEVEAVCGRVLIMAAGRIALDEGLETERTLVEPLFESEDAREGLSAFMEKRKPEFSR